MDHQLNICIFEDEGYKSLLPLTYMRPTWGLRCGMTVLLEKILRSLKAKEFSLHCRDYLAETIKKGNLASVAINKLPASSACVFINGRILAGEDLPKRLVFLDDDEVLVSGNQVAAARLTGKRLEFFKKALDHPLSALDFEPLKLDVRFRHVELPLITYPWELVRENARQITKDFMAIIKAGSVKGVVHESAVIYGKDLVKVDDGAQVMACAVLDARNGPIYIGRGVEVHPHTRINGPCYIGEKTKVLGGKIREGCSIGPMCKVNGELEGTIIQGYTNKQHDGFIGHSYIGEWVNLGAGTTNSDLKNNYGKVKVFVEGKETDSGEMFVGSFIGDHTKTGIGTMLNTGTVIGVACNIFGVGMPPKYMPSFSWGGFAGFTEHKLDEAIKTARIAMDRRGIAMTAADEILLRKIFELTSKDRSGVV